MLIALLVVVKPAITRSTIYVARGALEVRLQLSLAPKAQQACEACELVASAGVGVEVALECPLAIEGAETNVTGHLVSF